jgi:hypothetical protein
MKFRRKMDCSTRRDLFWEKQIPRTTFRMMRGIFSFGCEILILRNIIIAQY